MSIRDDDGGDSVIDEMVTQLLARKSRSNLCRMARCSFARTDPVSSLQIVAATCLLPS
jgi:hypothetical protein